MDLYTILFCDECWPWYILTFQQPCKLFESRNIHLNCVRCHHSLSTILWASKVLIKYSWINIYRIWISWFCSSPTTLLSAWFYVVFFSCPSFWCSFVSKMFTFLAFIAFTPLSWASQVALVAKNPLANAGDVRDVSSLLGSGRSPGAGHGNPF